MATGVAVLAFLRTVLQGLPTVEFLVERDASEASRYKLSVSNPTRRLLLLDRVDVISPSPPPYFNIPNGTMTGTIERGCEDASGTPGSRAVYLAVPAGETKCLEIEFKNNMNDEDFGIYFRFVWSKGLPFLDRWFMPRKIKLDSAQVKSRRLAAIGA